MFGFMSGNFILNCKRTTAVAATSPFASISDGKKVKIAYLRYEKISRGKIISLRTHINQEARSQKSP